MSSLSEPFIRRPVMTTLIMFAIILAGIISYQNLPVSDLPNVDYPVINVSAGLTGASPEVMANTVATPLEEEFMTISGLKVVKSSSSLGKTRITLEFDTSKKMDAAAQDVEAAISRASQRLPKNLSSKPSYFKQNPSQQPIMYFSLNSPILTVPELYEYGNNVVAKRLSMIDGVANVQVYGSKRQIDIEVDPDALAAKDLSMQEVKAAVVEANPHLPTGVLSGDYQTVTINTSGQLETKEGYESIIIKNEDGSITRLKDIATVSNGPPKDKIYFRYLNAKVDQTTVILAVQRLPGANSVRVSNDVHQLLPGLKQELPKAIDLRLIYDKAESIRDSVYDVQLTLLIALILVVGIIYLYLGKGTDTLIPSLVLPISLVGTFFAMYLLDYSIDNLSLLALTLAIGFVVDDAIVVVENIVRHIEHGEPPLDAAINGARQISFTVLSMTLSLAASFIPLVFMGGLVGKVFREFAVTLAVAVLISGFVSLTLTPMLASRFLTRRHIERKSHIAKFGELLNDRLLEFYKYGLDFVLKHRGFTYACAALTLVGTVVLLKVLPMKFLPGDDAGTLFTMIKTREGISMQETIERQKQVTAFLQKDPDVQDVISWVHGGSGNAFVRLKDRGDRGPTEDIVMRLNGQISQIPGIQAFVVSIPLLDLSLGDSGSNRFSYRIRGTNFEELVKTSGALVKRLRADKQYKNVTSDLELRKPQLDVSILRDQASIYGITAHDIETSLLNAYTGGSITSIELPDDQYDVTLGMQREFQKDPRSLDRLYIKSKKTGKNVPLSSVARWKETAGPKTIHHVNQFPSATIAFSLDPDANLNAAILNLEQIAKDVLPSSITGKAVGSAEAFKETFGNMGFLIAIAVISSFIVLGTLYESFIHPITILASLPLAMIGGLLSLWFFGQSLTLYSLVGLILLIGIVKKNGIMMVDHAIEQERHFGMSSEEAIYDACIVRFRPMMMTTIAAIMGALPIAIGIGASGGVRQPLGLVIVGGLMISQMLTLFLTPVVFLTLDKLRRKS